MGMHGLCARVRVGTLAGGQRGRRVIAPFVVSIGLLPALAGCSSFSSSPSSSDSASSAAVGIAGPVTGRGGVNVDPGSVSGPGEDTGPSGLLSGLFRSNSTPSAAPSNTPRPPSAYTASAPPYTPSTQTAAAPPPPGTYAPSTQTAAMPSPPSTYAAPSSLGIAGPVAGRGAVNVDPAPSDPACGRHGAQRPPCQPFQIQFDAVRGAVKYAAPAEHLHRLGAALYATARSGCPAGASAGKFRAVMIVSAQNWVSS